MDHLFTSESVSEGHPDKIADQISDALLDEFLRRDYESKVAIETLVTTGLVVLSGEVTTSTYVDVQQVARNVIRQIGYTKAEYMFDADSCGVISTLHEQSPDIRRGVNRENAEEQGAGDQGMMFGFACKETDDYMPLSSALSHILLQELAAIRKEGGKMTYLRPDSKSQVTIAYNQSREPVKVHTIVVSTQHDPFMNDDEKMLRQIRSDIIKILLPKVVSRLPVRIQKLLTDDLILHVNPTGKFVIGGPHGDTGLTGRKIIVDTYGGKGAHGGGAFSGKDPSKVDRSGAYAMRHIAKNLVAAGIAEEVLVQVAYAIGVARPVGFSVNTNGTSNINLDDSAIASKVFEMFDLRPAAIINTYGLKNPIYFPTASYGHMGRIYRKGKVQIIRNSNCDMEERIEKEVEFFAWEKLDRVESLQKAFGL
jgi:S-adenosylmethionine synthetase